MTKEFEIELRGPMTTEQHSEIIKKLDDEGEFLEDKERILIDYSQEVNEDMESRDKDIRLRVTNKVPEIVVKLGSWGGSEQREEISVLTQGSSFDGLVKIFGAMGYNKGVLCIRKTKAYMYKDVEFAFVEIPGYGFSYEAEKIVSDESKKDEATESIKEVCAELGLSI